MSFRLHPFSAIAYASSIRVLQPERFATLGIDPPKGVLLFGPPGTGKTLCARAVANRTDATFIRVIGSELVQKYVGEGARMVRELFEMARSKKACIIFFDEVDAIGGARFDDGAGGDNEVQRTMLELINQLDGFDPRGNIKVLMATNRSVCSEQEESRLNALTFALVSSSRPDTLDPALLRPGRLDRRVEFALPDSEGRAQIMRIHARSFVPLPACSHASVSDPFSHFLPSSVCQWSETSDSTSSPDSAPTPPELSFGRSRRRLVCSPSEQGGRSRPRRTSWMPSRRS